MFIIEVIEEIEENSQLKRLSPELGEVDAFWWKKRIEELATESQPVIFTVFSEGDYWLIENLPPTKGPDDERPGAEYGVEV